jgi:putative DNA methylase
MLATYIAIGVSRLTDAQNTLCQWGHSVGQTQHLFRRQAMPMIWDYAESSVFSDAAGDLLTTLSTMARVIENLGIGTPGHASQNDAQTQTISGRKVISTDPPYYDNIPYADLADFFYVWLRRILRHITPDLFATLSTPKAEELVALAYRHAGAKDSAEDFFLTGMTRAIEQLSRQMHPAFPVTIYYAFKQSESDDGNDTTNTGWDTFLAAVSAAGLSVGGTWPMRTERGARSAGIGTNALASSIVLVCRKRSPTAETISRRQFIRELNAALPQALDAMTRKSEGEHSPVAPVDLSQAIIGPGMAVFSKYAAVLEADGSPMTVRTALQLINRFLAEDDFDADTQFCLHWFEQHGWESGKFGEADTLARAKGTSVDGVKNSGVLQSAGGNVRLLKWADYKPDWDPAADDRLPVWEGLHQLVRVFKTDGESAAGRVLAAVAAKAESIRQLAYRLYTLCERAGRAEDARAYNELITSWAPIESAAAAMPSTAPAQKTLFE